MAAVERIGLVVALSVTWALVAWLIQDACYHRHPGIEQRTTVQAGPDASPNTQVLVHPWHYLLVGGGVALLVLILAGFLALKDCAREDALADRNRKDAAELARVRGDLAEARASLAEARARIQRAERTASLGVLAGGIAHEINTPIQFIGDNLSFIQTSLEDLEPVLAREQRATRWAITGQEDQGGLTAAEITSLRTEMSHAVRESLVGIDRVRDIVQAIRIFSHPDDIALQPRDPATLIDTVVAISRGVWKHVATIAIDIGPSLPAVPCYGSDIDQVLLALVMNATDAIEERVPAGMGRILIAARCVDGGVEFSVADNGCGIPLERRDRVWELFFTTKKVGKGTGQGLAICRHIVEAKHGGTIGFESTVGEGTRFYFTLPLKPWREEAA